MTNCSPIDPDSVLYSWLLGGPHSVYWFPNLNDDTLYKTKVKSLSPIAKSIMVAITSHRTLKSPYTDAKGLKADLFRPLTIQEVVEAREKTWCYGVTTNRENSIEFDGLGRRTARVGRSAAGTAPGSKDIEGTSSGTVEITYEYLGGGGRMLTTSQPKRPGIRHESTYFYDPGGKGLRKKQSGARRNRMFRSPVVCSALIESDEETTGRM
ncbi:hypothetical protein TREMEDRAFT_65690 [Tremella mesenterica DSM 1558]|uniref:uncharacterized protein n=1 Tax=Tremella mesenterica (strain ATCC 24925 / CBS 8224 / DSM 1558 / NBRC 9311 / NRRL Y-6157 / RJB 2259-6 / UBC 559-6) TaxID=578456 RepID=UPI00032BB843|nr:uncharacterized protein TREMEDRAFT_65690 [Tremella mesenterica DSM 1558]EIW66402.1 hypothetical protein TREMEDRAFT_65690 [Tremella mesenterica DSM 1558]